MENNLLNSMEISQKVKDKFDAVAKSVFSLKEIIADLLIYVMPEIFGNMDREEIVRECLTDSDNPDSIYITKLEPHYMKNTKHEHLYDIVFKVKLPQRWLSKKKRDSKKEFYLQNIEPQSSHGNPYSEEMRVVIYLSHLFLNENEYFQITESTKEEYKKALPVCSVWIMSEPSKVDRYSTHRYILIKEKEVNGYYIPVTNEDEFPVLSAYIINLGPDNH